MIYDTIAAVTTAPGKAAVGIVRLSGPDAFSIADQIFSGKSGVSVFDQRNYALAYGRAVDGGRTVDEVLLLKMQSPRSFTGEDVAEIQAHGGSVVLNRILRAAIKKGARLAEPGEFSKRAFIHGKMDLVQAEAMADLIQADHELLAETAADQMSGALTDIVEAMADKLLDWTAMLEASIDYPEEELENQENDQWREGLLAMCSEMDGLLLSLDRGKIIRQGLRVVLAGKPNVGKSSIMNALLDEERAIVTHIPGTTRDTLEESVLIEGAPIVLVDTAGLGETEDPVERIGIERARRAMEGADLVLYVLEVNKEIDREILGEIKALDPDKTVILLNKMDLKPELEWERTLCYLTWGWDQLRVSALKGEGLDRVARCLRDRFLAGTQNENGPACLINARHGAALAKAKEALVHALAALDGGIPLDMISIDLRQAWMSLGEMTGSVSDEDIIDRIFSKFCLGK
ncbi:MAG: tRNA uridine-5-carboxymethylaminomethyl(34) synthesis GTPase MnmE [Peptococcaceae bacterium]|jgi:tRNA modification GTPase|nr:tRNA uridine-5-carboxymethylaminomethyl(34) synthesis GTPase MnmE [Peptococcaceae bacterium]